MAKNNNLYLLLIFILVGILPVFSGCSKKSVIVDNANVSKTKFRVIGYLPGRENIITSANSIDYNKITYLYIAFINPDSLGRLTGTENLKTVADIAHTKGVKILVSIGGGSAPAYYPRFLTGEKRQKSYLVSLNWQSIIIWMELMWIWKVD